MNSTLSALRIARTWVATGRWIDLLSTRHHTPYLTRHRLVAIVTRTRLVALAFSLFTLVWIAFDAATLTNDQWRILGVFRIISAIVFLMLAIAPNHDPSRMRALTMLGIMLAVPLAIYGVSQSLLAGTSLNGLATMNGNLYGALPLVVLAGLCIFPLVVAEGLLFAMAIVSAVAVIQLALVGVTPIELLSTLWVLMLALGIYLLACAIQLHYMMALLRQASHDPLTGALTRRSGVEVLDLYFRLACEQNAPLSVLFVDADDFKSINDTYGHDTGDTVLKGIVNTLQDVIRQADMLIRWGGEEFLVIMTNTPTNGALQVVDRITQDWFGKRPDGRPLTASMGLAERSADAVEDWPQLVAIADERMYIAKQSGKARCVASG